MTAILLTPAARLLTELRASVAKHEREQGRAYLKAVEPADSHPDHAEKRT